MRLTMGFLYSGQGFILFNLFYRVIIVIVAAAAFVVFVVLVIVVFVVVVVVLVSIDDRIYIHVCITKKRETKR